MGTVADVIRVAEGELGKTDGSKYFAYFGYPDLGPWCVAGARWAYAQAEVDCHWETFYAFDWTDVPEQWAVRPEDLQPGDFVSFDWDGDVLGDHVGIVTGVHDWGIATIEFNTGYGVVAECQRVWSCVICGIRPTFAQEPHWVQAADGRWWYHRADGSYPANRWERIDGEWYFFDKDGWMQVGWLQWGGLWYYLSERHDGLYGHMVHGGVYADEQTGKCYAFNGDGSMIQGGTVTLQVHDRHDGSFGALEFA